MTEARLENTTTVRTDPPYAIVKALWYALYQPERGLHSILKSTADPTAAEAYAAILGNAKLNYGSDAAYYLKLAIQFAPQSTQKTDLSSEFFADAAASPAVMVANFSKFSGFYPQHNHHKNCKTSWMASGQGDTVHSFAPITFSLWRGYTMDSGMLMPPCEHCRHERIIDFCKRIETASELYRDKNEMRYSDLSEADAGKLADRLRKRRSRGDDVLYTTFPHELGTAVLHDADDIPGTELPTDRSELYNLVSGWVLSTPKGKRAGHGLGTWGKSPQRSGKPTGGNEEGQGDATEGKGKRFKIIGKDFSKVGYMLSCYLDTTYNPKGMKVNVKVDDFVKFLDEAEIDFAIEGDVTVNRYKPLKTSAKCDIQGDDRSKQLELGTSGTPKPILLELLQ